MELDEFSFQLLASQESLLQLRPVIALAALDLRELIDQRPAEVWRQKLAFRSVRGSGSTSSQQFSSTGTIVEPADFKPRGVPQERSAAPHASADLSAAASDADYTAA